MGVEAKTFIPVEEYLHTNYSPDCDYVDGEVLERNLAEFDHASLQTYVGACLLVYRKAGYFPVVEQRLQVSKARFRVPDVCLVRTERPMPRIFRKPPVIEILSPEDRLPAMQKRINDYLAFGVPNIWVIDPQERRAFICTREGWRNPRM